MREYLVTKFVCARCGHNLRLSEDAPKGQSHHAAGEPTGAAMVEQRVVIEPCACVTAPLDEIRSVAKSLIGICP